MYLTCHQWCHCSSLVKHWPSMDWEDSLGALLSSLSSFHTSLRVPVKTALDPGKPAPMAQVWSWPYMKFVVIHVELWNSFVAVVAVDTVSDGQKSFDTLFFCVRCIKIKEFLGPQSHKTSVITVKWSIPIMTEPHSCDSATELSSGFFFKALESWISRSRQAVVGIRGSGSVSRSYYVLTFFGEDEHPGRLCPFQICVTGNPPPTEQKWSFTSSADNKVFLLQSL